jgi:hypothetical protein
MEYNKEGTEAFAAWFETAPIEKFKLDWKGEDEITEFISKLAPSLRANTHTKGFHVNASGTNDAGCQALKEAFEGNEVLEEIIITDLSMTSQQFNSLLHTIPTMPNLATFVCWQASARIRELQPTQIVRIVQECQTLVAFYVGPLESSTEALIKHHLHHNQIKSRDLLRQDVTPLWPNVFCRLSQKRWQSELYSILREKPELMKTDYPTTDQSSSRKRKSKYIS